MKRIQYALMAVLATMALSCHEHHEGHEHHDHHDHEHHAHSHSHEHEHDHEEAHSSDEIIFSESKQEKFGIQTAVIEPTEFCESIHTAGSILPALGDEAVITAPVSGILTFSVRSLSEGSQVGSGSKIASISTNNAGGGNIVIKAKAAYEAAKSEYERDMEMVKSSIVSNSHFEKSRLAYEQAKAEYEALAGNEDGSVNVKSSLGGYVKAIYVNSGEFVEAGQAIATVSQNRSLRLRADVPQRYASSLRSINDANFSCADGAVYNVKSLGGRVVSYGRSAEDGYLPVTFEFANRGDIVAGSYVEVFLKGQSQGKVLAVPCSAIVEDQGVYSVFVRLDEEGFERREVKTGASDGQYTVILSGLEEGTEIVTVGAMHIKLASVAAVPAGHNHNH